MAHAWLDSLSEDWVSQPASDASFADAAPSPSSPSPDPKPKPRTPVASRIPRLSPRPKKPQTPADANSSSVLSERSTNERLAHASRRTPSKLSRELSLGSGRDCQACRSASTSNPNSVVRSTLHRKSASASSAKAKGETPEWKRRLVYGDLSYGEQRDLFTSAGTGLENIFKPPQPTPHPKKYAKADASYREGQSQLDVTLPPSPPLHRRDPSTVEIHLDESRQEQSQQLPQRAPMSVRYRRTEESADASRQSELSVDPASRSQAASMTEQTALSDGPSGESRKVSGQSVLRNEDFSPILLERRKASNGKTTFCPAELPPDELRKRLEKLRRNQMLLVSEGDESAAERRPANPAKSGNMEATEDLDRRGGFINFQRGGRSEEGSFRNRMLSSALNDSSELHPEESLQASTPKQFPTVRVERHEKSERIPADSPDLPRAPNPSPEKKPAPMPASTGSPLKLFQPYDTFTNQTLLRRLSQIHEEASDSSFSMVQDGARKHGLPSECSSVFLPPAARNRGVSRPSASANRFGAGELDGYEFNDEFSHMSNDASGMERDKENGRPGRDSALRPHPPIFDLSHNSSPSEPADLVVHRRRQKSTTSHPPRRSGRASFPAYGDMLSTPRRRRDITGSEIKRPRTSPSKDPTPKRRRTLHKSDVSYGTEGHAAAVDSVQLSHQQMQSAVGGLQPNMHEIGRQELPEPDLAGARQALRPRTPTPSQRSSLQRDRQPLAENERPPTRSSKRFQPPPALPVGSATETHRKPSIKTEDFINEANKIMAMIRSKAGLRSGLASLEESDEERGRPSPDLEGSFEESTQEPFSRPPSREGRPPLTRMSTKQEDPVLAERLKKYEEASDMGDMITASVRSTALSQAALSAAAEGGSVSKNVQSSHGSRATVSDADVVSDPPNLRLSRNPEWQEWQGGNGLHDGVPSQGSTGPPTQNTAMSIPTGSSRGSSRGSEARKTIAPESVLHLIPDQVGNMVLDRERNIWIKRKLSAESAGPSRSFVQSEASDDPFAGIPDLTVDMTLEMRNLRLLTGKKPASRDGVPGVAADISPSKPPRGGSVRESALVNGVVESAESRIHKQCPKPGMTGEAVEHEISINEDRASEPRRLTISFSSPIASVIQDVAGHHDVDSEDVSVLDGAPENLRQELRTRGRRIISIHASTKNKSAQSQSHSHGPPRHFPVKGQAFIARPVSRIDERDEDSVQGRGEYQEAASGMELSVLGDYSVVSRGADRGQRASLSFLVATPARPQGCPVAEVDAGPIISQYVGTFSLSPMSDFTMHRAEESLPLEASYVVGNHRLVTGDRTRRVVSASVRDLVAKLAEVEPFEPYWEDMRELELRDKGLNAVHALDEFCGQLESLDVSRNNIRNLSGVPSSVRRLRVTDNQLSSLTAWSHLMNLQYVDVSNNGLTSLAPFKSLIHLRSLRADNNQITSLDGIKFHKGLQTLRVRGNAIEEVDFDASTLEQLTELDLKDNKIRRVANLGRLPALNSLNLEGNQLESFALESEQPMNSLRYLRLDDNKLSALDVKKLPHLRLLHADRNYLVRIWGFSRARRIDSLSLREQRGATPLDLPHLLSRAYEVRKLYLSGNLVESFAPPVDLLNLQLLELANCGLTALPRHLGLALPNLRVLNLNLNALADLRPLRAVPRLKRLLAAGNRLADPAALVAVLARFRHMAVVDLRDNPLTQGFYAPMAAQQVVVMHHRHDRDRQQQHHHRCGAGTREEEQQQRDEDRRGDSGGEGFSLPDQDGARDGAYCGRLDMDTRVRRRLYEVLVRERCARVRRLDGLPVVGRRQGEGEGKGKPASGGGEEGQEKKEEEEEEEDVVWLAMAEKGLVVVRARGEGEDEEDGKVASEADRSARWPAEDSFA